MTLASMALLLAVVACTNGCGAAARRPGQPSNSGFRTTSALFAPLDGGLTAETLAVAGAGESKVVPALQAAGRRWYFVTEDGEDLSHLAPDVAALEEASGGRYTPNFVFDVYRSARGPALAVDCKGAVPPPMAATFIRIVEQELRRVGITSAIFDDGGPTSGREETLAPVSGLLGGA